MDLFNDIIAYTVPSLVTGAVAYLLFTEYFKNEQSKKRYKLHFKYTETTLPLRLQAYERMVLFLERINPQMLLMRVKPQSDDVPSYLSRLISHIEMEYEHNLSQQIYISDKAWNLITASKNATIQILRNTASGSDITNSETFREAVLQKGLQDSFPATSAIVFLKSEVTELF